MNRFTLAMLGMFALTAAFSGGCSQEVSHSESTKPNILNNGQTHEETTIYKNPDGTYSTEKEKEKTSN